MNFTTILFDLDGTLTDPGIGITNSVMYALEKFGITVDDRRALYTFIGPPLWESFSRYYGFSEDASRAAVDYYREHYRVTGIFENSVYDGIAGLLAALKDSGKTLAVATSKPEVFAKQILDHFDLAKYFTLIGGSELDGTRVQKAEVIRYVLDRCGVTDLASAVMVGDREHDILGAKKTGIASVGVLFGYGSREELEDAGADFIAGTVADLGAVLLSGRSYGQPAEGGSITVSEENPKSRDAQDLMRELSDCLQTITGSSGRHSVSTEDFLADRSLFAVARDASGLAIGCGGYRNINGHTAELKRMYARKMSSGVGSKILTYLENRAARDGYHTLRLETRLVNIKAVTFYERNGYCRIPNYGIYEDRPEAVCFEKRLPEQQQPL